MTTITTRVVLPGIVEPEGLRVETVPAPEPRPGQVRLAVEATGVSFAEQQMRHGRYFDQPTFPFVPGYDAVGIVDAVGRGVDAGLVGQRVAALLKTGGWATSLCCDAQDLVRVPDGLSAAQAESLLLNGLTAWQMLHRSARPRPGGTVLVHGARSGVGSILVPLARLAGLRVLGTASGHHLEAVAALGAEPIDYTGDVAATVRELAPEGLDAVFDHLGGESARRSWSLLRRGGALVAYGNAAQAGDDTSMVRLVLTSVARTLAWNLLPNGRRASFYNVWGGHRITPVRWRTKFVDDLTAVFRLAAVGALPAPVGAEIALPDAARALRLAESRAVPGKVVLTVSAAAARTTSPVAATDRL